MKKKKDNKSEKITVRLTPSEKKILEEKAHKSNMSLSKYVRQLLLKNNLNIIYGFDKLLPELNRIGNNINQIAFKFNTNQITNTNFKNVKSDFDEFIVSAYKFMKGNDSYGDN